ncbi:MAG: MBOAT family protein [Rhodospirillaceae bacterium]|nr:MAG: MBOAT family protein [Rhodospirillaceae bacterium]
MVFSSTIFVFLYLPLVLLTYFCAGARSRNATLLGFSFLYYAWGEGSYFAIILIPILLNWAAGLALHRAKTDRARNLILLVAVTINLAVLLHFKYTNFIIANLNALIQAHGIGLTPFENEPIHLPLGISFFTFHALSYIIDVYRRVVPPQRNVVNFALYISFFPQLVAGPIVRYHDVSSQLTERRHNLDKFASGLERLILGVGKKMLIANPLGAVTDRVFALNIADLSTPVAWLGIVSYTFQIYFDFSGYSDMAIGLARMFGFEFLENFNYPYVSASMREFWRRWHISLSNWFRDYLYVPLGGNRSGKWGTYRNLIIVFLLCGFWHGASWNFLVWGLIHGLFLALERGPVGTFLGRLPRLLKHCYVMLVVMVAWVFFRADTLPQAVSFLSAMFGNHTGISAPVLFKALLDRKTVVLLSLAAISSTPLFSILARDWRGRLSKTGELSLLRAEGIYAVVEGVMTPVRPIVLAAIFVLSAAYLAGQTYNPFIYFRF